jgi:hypothetical protein
VAILEAAAQYFDGNSAIAVTMIALSALLIGAPVVVLNHRRATAKSHRGSSGRG